MQRGESPIHRDFGVRFAEYFSALRSSPWFRQLLKLEMVRQASIPYHDVILKRQYTPLQCVERVWDVQMLSEFPSSNRLPIRVDLEVNGVGRWQRDISAFLTSEHPVSVAEHGASANLS